MDGVIDGGWNFVWSAYGLTWLGLLGYIIWLLKGLAVLEAEAEDGQQET